MSGCSPVCGRLCGIFVSDCEISYILDSTLYDQIAQQMSIVRVHILRTYLYNYTSISIYANLLPINTIFFYPLFPNYRLQNLIIF